MSPLEEMLQSYVAAALWSSTCKEDEDDEDDQGDTPMDSLYNEDDIHPDTLELMKKDCEKFLNDNEDDIDGRYSDAGHDFWLTRNGHGVGFWEKPDWPEEEGERLTEAAKSFGECYLYVGDDGKVYQG